MPGNAKGPWFLSLCGFTAGCCWAVSRYSSFSCCLAPVGLKLQWFSREHLALQMGVSSCIYEVPAGRLHAQEDILSPMHGIPDQEDAAYYP
ncbi:hypothetical protein I7I50_12608 [Histoplasma capsulatum G186AR]|uniref:Secreted protein n=1 Tax=Ajellomyces capsulatus TaxID=5037 RepID=A0A8H8CRP6_AJECA|nr:hypothetical protein I7I52_11087 [Histoplasma capsulatum]QSS70844.1 hypothetical protein I7I50_12608 [Histoplasma capsulatum G186AR]